MCVIIPTLGKDLNLLERAVESVLNQTRTTSVLLVAPPRAQNLANWALKRDLEICFDNDFGTVSDAINCGVAQIEKRNCKYFIFLGDDDLLLPNAVFNLEKVLKSKSKWSKKRIVASFGYCWYVSSDGETIFENRAPVGLLKILKFIPNVIPHPGALMYVSDWRKLGGFDPSLRFAPDLDYWLRLKDLGRFARVSSPMSYFGWGSGLTSTRRSESILEAKLVRRRYLSWWELPVYWLLEPISVFLGEKILRNRTKTPS